MHVSSNGSNKLDVWNEGREQLPDGTLGPTSWAGGGGISRVVERPAYQMNTTMPLPPDGNTFRGRGVPDVSGDAATSTGYLMLDSGYYVHVGGTSAVAPLWAGLLARINQDLPKPAGFLNQLLYEKIGPNKILRDISVGNNDVNDAKFGHINGYSAATGWDACTGWGSPDGEKLLNFLQGNP